MYCRNCAKEISNNALFCVACGEPCGDSVTMVSPVKPWSTKKLTLVLIGYAIFPFIGMIFGGMALAKEPTRKQGIITAIVTLLSVFVWTSINY